MNDSVEARPALVAIRQIEPLGDTPPFRIALLPQRDGMAMSTEDVMSARIRWAERAGYKVLTRNLPPGFLPFNTVIRVNAGGTEDQNRDYLARIVGDVH